MGHVSALIEKIVQHITPCKTVTFQFFPLEADLLIMLSLSKPAAGWTLNLFCRRGSGISFLLYLCKKGKYTYFHNAALIMMIQVPLLPEWVFSTDISWKTCGVDKAIFSVVPTLEVDVESQVSVCETLILHFDGRGLISQWGIGMKINEIVFLSFRIWNQNFYCGSSISKTCWFRMQVSSVNKWPVCLCDSEVSSQLHGPHLQPSTLLSERGIVCLLACFWTSLFYFRTSAFSLIAVSPRPKTSDMFGEV